LAAEAEASPLPLPDDIGDWGADRGSDLRSTPPAEVVEGDGEDELAVRSSEPPTAAMALATSCNGCKRAAAVAAEPGEEGGLSSDKSSRLAALLFSPTHWPTLAVCEPSFVVVLVNSSGAGGVGVVHFILVVSLLVVVKASPLLSVYSPLWSC